MHPSAATYRFGVEQILGGGSWVSFSSYVFPPTQPERVREAASMAGEFPDAAVAVFVGLPSRIIASCRVVSSASPPGFCQLSQSNELGLCNTLYVIWTETAWQGFFL